MRKRRTYTLTVVTGIALLGATISVAQGWTFSASPDSRITHSSGWVFQVSVANTYDLTVTNCVGAPTVRALPFVDPVSSGYKIVRITGPNRVGGVLGSYANRASSLTLPTTLLSIGNDAFYFCTSLTGSLTIPNGVTSIGASAFNGCTAFTGSLIISDTVKNIEAFAFRGTWFSQIVTPSTGVTFGNQVFAFNSLLRAVYYSGAYPAAIVTGLYDSANNVTSYVHHANCETWVGKDTFTGSFDSNTATWMGRRIVCLNHPQWLTILMIEKVHEGVRLTWRVDNVLVEDPKFVVYASEDISAPLSEWARPTPLVVETLAGNLRRVTVGAAGERQFYRVRAE